MTAVAAVTVEGTPVLVGDVVLSDGIGQRIDYAGKIYEVGTNVAIGWSGVAGVAKIAIGRLRSEFDRRWVTEDALREALARLADLRGGSRRLDLLGWIVGDRGPRVVRWASHYDPYTFSEAEDAIGSGGDLLRKMLAPPAIGGGNSVGYDTVPLKAANGFIEARFEEMLRADWPRTWGAAFDLLVHQEGRFRWLPSLTYVAWNLTIDHEEHLVRVEQLPEVYKQERVKPCTVMFGKVLGESRHVAKVSTPIDSDDVDQALYLRRPYSARSDYYANYFRLFRGEKFLLTMPTVVAGATRKGLVYHDSDDPEEPRFQINQENIETVVHEILARSRGEVAPNAPLRIPGTGPDR